MSPELSTGRHACEQRFEHGILAKEAHGQTLRLAPPLVASEDDIDLVVAAFRAICFCRTGARHLEKAEPTALPW